MNARITPDDMKRTADKQGPAPIDGWSASIGKTNSEMVAFKRDPTQCTGILTSWTVPHRKLEAVLLKICGHVFATVPRQLAFDEVYRQLRFEMYEPNLTVQYDCIEQGFGAESVSAIMPLPTGYDSHFIKAVVYVEVALKAYHTERSLNLDHVSRHPAARAGVLKFRELAFRYCGTAATRDAERYAGELAIALSACTPAPNGAPEWTVQNAVALMMGDASRIEISGSLVHALNREDGTFVEAVFSEENGAILDGSIAQVELIERATHEEIRAKYANGMRDEDEPGSWLHALGPQQLTWARADWSLQVRELADRSRIERAAHSIRVVNELDIDDLDGWR